ncbi:hypothetical protein Q5O89_20875 [Peribacillus frigoritolerans]|nr:hypothetical protein [Peribacillus frigoritolerans]
MQITKNIYKMDIRAKLLVYPLVDDKFYVKDLFEKYIYHPKKEKEAYYQDFIDDLLVKNVYPLLAKKNYISNLEEIRLLIEQYFPKELFISSNSTCHLYFDYLTELSKVFLTHRNGQISLKYWESNEYNEKENRILGPYRGIYKIAVWNSLNRTFTTDLLAILYLLDLGMEDEYSLKSFAAGINVSDTQLDKILSKGIAETHLHLNAAGSFDFTWQTLMSNQKVDDQVFLSTFKYDKEIKYFVKAMSIIRIVLAMFLKAKVNFKNGLTLSEFIKNHYIPHGVENFDICEFFHLIINGEKLSCRITEYELSEVVENLKLNLNLLPTSFISYDYVSRFGQNDIIYQLLGTFGEDNTVERVLLFRAIKYLKINGEIDNMFNDIFWQYIRIKNQIFQLHVQQNSINGLEYFVEYFGRATEVRVDDEEQRLNYLLNYQAQNPFLKKMEVRISVGRGKDDKEKKLSLARKLKSFFTAYLQLINEFEKNNKTSPSIGIIVHFIKSRIKFRDDGDIYETYGRKIKNYHNEMQALIELREEVNGLSNYIVGIDAAGEELVTEPWMFSKIFQQARDSKSQKLFYDHLGHNQIQNLGLTYHVGEDFRNLLTGLRWIDEVIEHFQYHAGDRIGHAVALGIDVNSWANENPVITLPRNEHLENLLWVWDLCIKGRCPIHIDIPNIEYEILKYAKTIYKKQDFNIYELHLAYKSKFNLFDFNVNSSEKNIKDPLLLEMFDRETLKKMKEPIQIKIEKK